MGRYHTKLVTKNIGGGFHELVEPFVYESRTVGFVVVPTGFRTNFASVPRLPLIYLLFGGIGDEEAVIHDWLYTPPHQTHTHCGITVSRSTADSVFRGARYAVAYRPLSEYESVNLWNIANNIWAYFGAWCMWAGVRLFGWRHWRES